MKPEDITGHEHFPPEIRDFLNEYHSNSLSGEHCITCNSACCSQGGFAILENVVMIYQAYEAGRLKRKDYEFSPGLSFAEFVSKYFDVRSYFIGTLPMGREMLFFHMRNLDPDNNLISIPEGVSYWETRFWLFKQNPALNHGCIFLSEKVPPDYSDDRNTGRHCILHDKHSLQYLSQKPIDCLVFTCEERPGIYKKPRPEQTEQLFKLLSKYYPDSVGRFKKLIA
jgi:hypothetical protein